MEVALDFESRHETPVLQGDLVTKIEITRNRANLADRVGDQHVLWVEVLFDECKDELGRADTHQCRHLTHVRVADDDMESTKVRRIAMGLISRIDDGSLDRRLESDFFLEEIGAL